MMKRIVIQIYEVQDPEEAQALIALGVDHIGSVIVSSLINNFVSTTKPMFTNNNGSN